MPNIPQYRTTEVETHSWTIGHAYGPTDAKEFRFGLHYVYQEMEKLGVDLSFDDAFRVTAGDGGEIIFSVTIEKRN